MKNEVKVGEKKKKRGVKAERIWDRKKRHVHTVYSQMNERVRKKNQSRKQKSEAATESEFGEKSSFVSFLSFVFSPFSRDFVNSYPAVPPS